MISIALSHCALCPLGPVQRPLGSGYFSWLGSISSPAFLGDLMNCSVNCHWVSDNWVDFYKNLSHYCEWEIFAIIMRFVMKWIDE